MDKIDSMMVESEENSLAFSQNSNMILRQRELMRDQSEIVEKIFRDNRMLNKMALSKFVNRQIFNKFKELRQVGIKVDENFLKAKMLKYTVPIRKFIN